MAEMRWEKKKGATVANDCTSRRRAVWTVGIVFYLAALPVRNRRDLHTPPRHPDKRKRPRHPLLPATPEEQSSGIGGIPARRVTTSPTHPEE